MPTYTISIPIAALLALGCEVTSDDSNADTGGAADTGTESGADDTGAPGVDPDRIEYCQQSACEGLLTFGCISIDEHEQCFLACTDRSEVEIDIFESCIAASDTCSEDPAQGHQCLLNFLDADPLPDPDTGADTGPEPVTCVEACNAYIGMGCEPPVEGVSSCADFCGMLSETLQEAVVECLQGAEGCTLPADCMIPTSG